MLLVKKLSRTSLIIFLITFFPLFILYLFTAPRSIYWQDASLFAVTIKTLGIMHPPGFPLYIMSAKIWVEFWRFVTQNHFEYVYYIHTYSAFWGAAAAAMVTLTSRLILTNLKKENSAIINLVLPTISGYSAGLSYSLWEQSTNAEVFSMSAFFMITIFFILVKLSQTAKHVQKQTSNLVTYFRLLFLVWGLSLSVHPANVLIFPALVYFLYQLGSFRRPNLLKPAGWMTTLLIFLSSYIVPFLYLPIRSAANPDFLWQKIDNLKTFFYFISGREYFTQPDSIRYFYPERIASYPVLFFQEYYILATLLGLAGLVFLAKKKGWARLLPFFIGIYFLTIYPFLSVYQRGNEFNYYLINFYILFALFIPIGTSVVSNLLGRNKNTIFVYLIAIAMLLPQFVVNLTYLNRRDYTLAEDYGKNILRNLPPNSILFVYAGHDSVIPLYLQEVKNFRKDIVLLRLNDLREMWKIKRTENKYPDLNTSPLKDRDAEFDISMKNFIANNLKERNVFLTSPYSLSTSNEYLLAPTGPILQLTEKGATLDLRYWNFNFSDPQRYNKPERTKFARGMLNGDGKITDGVNIKFQDEAKILEITAYTRLFMICHDLLINSSSIEVINSKGLKEKWEQNELTECMNNSFAKINNLNPKTTSGFSQQTLNLLWRESVAGLYLYLDNSNPQTKSGW